MGSLLLDLLRGNLIGSSYTSAGADLGGGCRGCAPPPEMTCGFLIQLVFCEKKTMWFIGVEVEQETSAPPPKKNPGSAPVQYAVLLLFCRQQILVRHINRTVYILVPVGLHNELT